MLHYIKNHKYGKAVLCWHKYLLQNLGPKGSQGSLKVAAHTDTGVLSCFSASPFSNQGQEQ